jgi:hypothetical protein
MVRRSERRLELTAAIHRPELIDDSVTKYILNELDVKAFDDIIAKWRATGWDQILKEYEAEYKKLNRLNAGRLIGSTGPL